MNRIILLLIFITFLSPCLAKDQPHLDGMPSSKEVVAKIKGSNPRETYAKQIAVLRTLWGMIRLHEMDEYHSKDTPKETMLLKDYDLWQKKLRDEYSAEYENLGDSATNASFRIYARQLETNELKNYIVENLFNETAKKRYYEVRAFNKKLQIKDDEKNAERTKTEQNRIAEEQKQKARETTNTFNRGAGMLLMVIPTLVYMFWVGRRRFNRTNQYGVLEYKNWLEMVLDNLLELFIGIIVAILFLLGMWFLITSFGN